MRLFRKAALNGFDAEFAKRGGAPYQSNFV